MPSVEVIIPWFPLISDSERERNFQWVRQRYLDSGLAVRPAASTSKRFCKADAVIPALEASEASVVVVADADVWCDHLPEAIAAVRWDCELWAIPHYMVHRLDHESTLRYMEDVNSESLELARKPYIGYQGGGITVLPRETALDIPLDKRFIGWGGEDEAWGYALHVLLGPPWRRNQDSILYHLYHRPQSKLSNRVGSHENESLRQEYFRAIRDESKMRKVVEDGKSAKISVK